MPMEISLLLIGATVASRCLTALGPSCPISTHQRTPSMAPRAWHSHLMVMWQWQTLGTTASRFTDTCSSALRQWSSLLQAMTTTQPMYSTGCNDLSNIAFWCAHQLKSQIWLSIWTQVYPPYDVYWRLFLKVGNVASLGQVMDIKLWTGLEPVDGIIKTHLSVRPDRVGYRLKYLMSHNLSKCMKFYLILMPRQQCIHQLLFSWAS